MKLQTLIFSRIIRYSSTYNPVFKASDVEIIPIKNKNPVSTSFDFGANFTDHMLTIDWDDKNGWHRPVISEFRNFDMHPASSILHYAIGSFEGMKAHRCEDGRVRLFRPMENMERLVRSSERSCLPTFDTKELLKLIKKLVKIDERFVPNEDDQSLYIRPAIISTSPILGLNIPTNARLFVVNSPVGFYYKEGIKPLSLLADPKYVRATYGGCGQYKMAANYAPTVAIQREAANMGCSQVLWLYGEEHFITEVGTMNIFVHLTTESGENQVVTHPLDGLILPGVTRKSIIEILKDSDKYQIVERNMSMKELVKAVHENRVHEIIGCGTACVVSCVGNINYLGEELRIPCPKDGSLFEMLLGHFKEIKRSKKDHPWLEPID